MVRTDIETIKFNKDYENSPSGNILVADKGVSYKTAKILRYPLGDISTQMNFGLIHIVLVGLR
jgi:hypothetical protein